MALSTFRLLILSLLLLTGTVQAQRLAGGDQHSASIHADGTLWTWGANSNGQLGNGTTVPQTTPIQVGTATNWRSVSTGGFHTVALRTDGTLWVWGMNAGQLGITSSASTQTTPVQLDNNSWQSVSAGYNYTLALRADGTLWAWGANENGQLGIGTGQLKQPTPTQIGTAANWKSIIAGPKSVAGLRTDGTLWTWGANDNAQLGYSTPGFSQQSTPVQVGAVATWQTVVVGLSHMLALQIDGTLWAWGDNIDGQLGIGSSITHQLAPTQVGVATTWQRISAGDYHSAAIRTDGTLWTWGDNTYSQLGNGSSTSTQFTPLQISSGASWQAVSTGANHTLALRTDGSLWAWGYHAFGQLGNGRGQQAVPGQVTAPNVWRSLAMGIGFSTAIRPNGTLWAWGNNTAGILGNGTAGIYQPMPTQVGVATSWQSVAAGNAQVLAIRTDGTLWAWGANSNGQLGTGNGTSNQLSPLQVGTAANWQSVSIGASYTLAIRTDGTLWAWGLNGQGQLGIGSTASQPTPTQVGLATNWQRVSAGDGHTIAIRTDGTLWAWGLNSSGQLGTGTNASSSVPVQISAASWKSIAAGISWTAAVRTDGTLWTWGYGGSGQLGTGNTTSQNTPAQVGTATNWQYAAGGGFYSAALRTDGTLWAWGRNEYGQLGIGGSTTQLLPVQVGTSSNWQSLATGGSSTAALRADGTLWTWGLNNYGQLALPNTTPLPTYIPNGGTALAAASPAPTAAWQLVPNPAHGRVQLAGLSGPVAGQLFDAQGRLVRTTTAAEVGLAGLAPGLYLLRATAGGATRTLRLVVE